jgi:phospholipase C
MAGHTRRDFLKVAAMLSGAAGASGFIPDSIQRAFAIEPAPGSTYMDAEHIVILMQENRSFDHTLGTLQGVRGYNDPRALKLANGNSVFVQTDAAGKSYAPWRLDIRDTRITWMGSIPHSRNSQVDAWSEGQHDGWLEAKRSYNHAYSHLPLTMGHYTREDLPFYYALADAFTVCDQSYCGVMTSTTPNRSMFWTGTVRDAQRSDSKVYMRNDQYFRGNMTWKTYPERLHEAGISWKFYQNGLTFAGGMTAEEQAWLSNFGCNLLECFAAYKVEANPEYGAYLREKIDALAEQIEKDEQTLSTENDTIRETQLRARLEDNNRLLEQYKASLPNVGDTLYGTLTPQQRQLHDAAFVTNSKDPHYRLLEPLGFEDDGKDLNMNVPKGDLFYQFRKDVESGKLPAVSWLSAPEKFSDHPTSPWYGAWYVSEVMDILTKNPEVWKKTIFILTYDENDGYFDHAPSFVAADPKRPSTGGASSGIDTGLEYSYAADELAQGVHAKDARSGPIGLGYRIPTIVASPWSRGGWVNSQLFDHTSTLMFLEDFVQKKYGKQVKEENISAWRRAISGDLTSCFRPHDSMEPALNFLDRDKFVVGIEKARFKEVPSDYRELSAAEIEQINRNPVGSSLMPHQEAGVRPSCAIPYELYSDGRVSADAKKFELSMTAAKDIHGELSSGAPFNVYLRGVRSNGKTSNGEANHGMTAATFAVKPGDVLRQEFALEMFADERYLIDVHGPNGFYRSFMGASQASPLHIEVVHERRGSEISGNVEVRLRNVGQAPIAVTLQDNSYKTATVAKKVAAGVTTSVVLRLGKSHGWYDFSVSSDGNVAVARYAGHVDTGKPSFSDPVMAGEA